MGTRTGSIVGFEAEVKRPGEQTVTVRTVRKDTSDSKTEEFLDLCGQNKLTDTEKERLLQLAREEAVNIRAKTKPDKQNGLHLLCANHEDKHLFQLVRFLLEKGVNVNIRDAKGRTPLHLLCCNSGSERLLEVIRLLVEHGVDVNARVTLDGCNAIHCLCCNDQNPQNMVKVAKFLVSQGIDSAERTIPGTNALHLLFQNNHGNQLLDMTKFLVRKGVDVTACDQKGYNPLHHLCTFNRSDQLVDVAEYIIKQGVNPAIRVNENNALDLFLQYGQKENTKGCHRSEMISLLKEHGLESDLEDNERTRCKPM